MSNKNTVSAENQLKQNSCVTFFGDGALKIMFVGNSITRHGVLEEIGWLNDYGMAASSIDKDYVHLVAKKVDEKVSAKYCICQAADWETHHKNPEEVMSKYEDAKNFGADIIIMRIVENAHGVYDDESFRKNYPKFIDYLNTNNGKVILTSGFWPHKEADKAIEDVAKEKNFPFIYLGDLGENPDMRAIGKFWHEGVQYHPGDLGMENIAERIFAEIEKLI